VAAGKRDIEIVKGDDYVHVVNIKTRAGAPVVITGYTYQAQLRKVKTQADPDATFTALVSDGPNGEITITLDAADTSDLAVACYQWDLQQDTGTAITTILAGEARFVSDVTR